MFGNEIPISLSAGGLFAKWLGSPLCGGRRSAEMCSGSEAGSYLRLVHFVYHSTLGLRVIRKKKIHEMAC